jgi:hypothetical protein
MPETEQLRGKDCAAAAIQRLKLDIYRIGKNIQDFRDFW